jgi:hypothetical protein
LSDYRGKVVHLTIGEGACRTDSVEGIAALSLLVARPVPPGSQFLIDTAGYLRDAWFPGEPESWTTPAGLAREIATVKDHPLAAPSMAPMAGM